ncbi:hypothetical protein OK016_24900 [Vibrio chagasii]|nr:hypothetical protein [Vibrio chagasii]
MTDNHYREPALFTFLFTASWYEFIGYRKCVLGALYWITLLLHNYKVRTNGYNRASQAQYRMLMKRR